MTKQRKPGHSVGPRAVGGLIRWRKGPLESEASVPPEYGQMVALVFSEDSISVRKWRGVAGEPWHRVQFWIPWLDIAPHQLLPKPATRRQT